MMADFIRKDITPCLQNADLFRPPTIKGFIPRGIVGGFLPKSARAIIEPIAKAICSIYAFTTFPSIRIK